MALPSPFGLGGSLLRGSFGRQSRKGLFLCDGEAAGSALPDEGLVHIGHQLFEAAGVEAVGDDALVADDVLTGFQLLGVLQKHLLLDGVAAGVGLRLRLLNELFQLADLLDLADDVVLAHVSYLLYRYLRGVQAVGRVKFICTPGFSLRLPHLPAFLICGGLCLSLGL